MPNKPNLLLLWSDQHVQTVSGCYGDAIVRTPHLDGLARSGVVFDNAYCPAPVCVPSRMSMLTARHPHQQECWNNSDILGSEVPTFAHSLGVAGYETMNVGRLHSMGPDQLRGFSRREVGDHSSNWIGGRAHDLGVLKRANGPFRDSLVKSGSGQCSYALHDKDVTDAACAYLGEMGRRRAAGDSKPFAAVVGFLLPHPPYVCPGDLYRMYREKLPDPRPAPDAEHPYINWWRHNRGVADAPIEEIRRTRAAYYGAVTQVDALIGRVLDTLKQQGLAGNTIVAYTSDHGDQLGNRGLWWKCTLYDDAVKVPLIVSAPGRIAGGTRRKQIVNLIDLTATLLDLLGAPALPDAQGRSLAGLLADAASPWLDETFSEYGCDGADDWSGGRVVVQRMIRSGKWKMVHHHGFAPELFDLAADPLETADLAADPRYRGIRDTLSERLLAGWDPHWVERRLLAKRRQHDLLDAWAQKTVPPDTYRWPLKAEDNWLDAAPGKLASAAGN